MTSSTTIRRMSPRPPKPISPKSKRFEDRFALHLRDLLDKRKLTRAEFVGSIQRCGVDVSPEAVHKWLSGQRIPRPQDMEGIALALGLADYRHILPPPA